MNVYVIGSFMNDNFGDYLLYHETMKSIQNSVRGGGTSVISSDVSLFYDKFDKVKRMKHKDALRVADVVIFTGGGYFGEGNRKKLLWNLFFVKHYGAKALSVVFSKKPYAIVGVGAGPFKYWFSRAITKKVFNCASLISVRDQESKDFLKYIGVNKEIEVHADWILGMDCNEHIIAEEEMTQKFGLKKGKYLLLHLISRVDGNSGMEIALADIRRYLCHNPDIKVIVTSDQTKKDVYERTKELANLFEDDLALYYEYKSPWELLSIINSAQVVITDKLHVGIVSVNLGKNVISLPLHSKTPRFYKQIGRLDSCKEMKEIKVGDVYAMIEKAYKESPKDVRKMKNDSLANRKILENFIGTHSEDNNG